MIDTKVIYNEVEITGPQDFEFDIGIWVNSDVFHDESTCEIIDVQVDVLGPAADNEGMDPIAGQKVAQGES